MDLQFLLVEFHRSVKHDGGQMFRHETLFSEIPDVFGLFSLEFIDMGDQVLHAAIFTHKDGGVLLTNAWDARDIVGGISPEPKDVDELLWVADAIFFADLFRSAYLGGHTKLGRFID